MLANRLFSVKLAAAVAIIFSAGLVSLEISRQTPLGSIDGRVYAQESGGSIPGAQVHLSIEEEGGANVVETVTDRHGRFSLRDVPAGNYVLRVTRCQAHNLEPINVVVEEGRVNKVQLEMRPVAPWLELQVHQHVFTPNEHPSFLCRGFTESSDVRISFFRADTRDFLVKSHGSIEQLLGSRSYYRNDRWVVEFPDLDKNPSLIRKLDFNVTVARRDAEGVYAKRINVQSLGPGLYIVRATANGAQKLEWILVTSLGIVTKHAENSLLCYVTDLATGKPVKGASIDAVVGELRVGGGFTDSNGLLKIQLSNRYDEGRLVVIAESAGSTGFVSSWFSGEQQQPYEAYVYTERPVYRAGQTVFFKGILRARDGDKYKVVAGKIVSVEARDSRDTLVYKRELRTDSFGCYYGNIHLNEETSSGYYNITTTVDDQRLYSTNGFTVMAYRKPEFEVKVKFDRQRYTRGQTATARISARYYFGSPVSGAKLRYYVHRSPYWLYLGDEDYGSANYEADYEDYGGYGEPTAAGEMSLDDNGEALITIPVDWPKPKSDNSWDSDQEFSVEAEVVDSSEGMVSQSASVLVTRGAFALQIEPDRYVVEPGSSVNARITAMTYNRKPVANTDVVLTVGTERWTSDGRRLFKRILKRTLTTDREGKASARFTARAKGDIVMLVEARDSKGNVISERGYVWCYGGAGQDPYSYRGPELKMVADKKAYNPGETAKLLITSAKPADSVLVTVEGERLYDHRVIKMRGSSAVVEIPVRDNYKPNFYVSACYVKNKRFITREKLVSVRLKYDKLNIKLTANKKKYKPGEIARYDVLITDSRGRPVRAELSIGVVDEAIYSIAKDNTESILDFFYQRKSNQVRTTFSFPEIYLSDPDKAGSGYNGVVRKRFVDTAFWVPNVVTDARGRATISFRMPDNLTTWVTTVKAITTETRCGELRSKVVTRKDFLVRLEMPRFLVQTDQSVITAVVHNYTCAGREVRVELGAPGLKIDGEFRRDITVGPHSVQRVDWRVTAEKPGSAQVTVYATSGNLDDAVRMSLPILPHGQERQSLKVVRINGEGAKSIFVQVRKDAIPQATRLRLTLAPSIAARLFNSLDYLARYPYGCTEQTTSSFIPDVIICQMLRDVGVRSPRLEKQLPDMVAKGLNRLYRFQLGDGGWGWCEYGKADPWMTAYVCYGLIEARDAGFAVNETVLSNGLDALAKLAHIANDDATRAFCCYVLAMEARSATSCLDSLASEKTSYRALALLSLSYSKLGQTDKARAVLDRLMQRATSGDGTIYWGDYENYEDHAVETTALALRALIAQNPQDPRATAIVRWLLSHQQSGYWISTRETAFVLYAVSDYLRRTKELAPDCRVSVFLNGRRLGAFQFGPESVFEPSVEVTIDGGHLRPGRNEITLANSGRGALYCSAQLTQFVARRAIPITITDSGLKVVRHYYKPDADYFSKDIAKALGRPISQCCLHDVIVVRLDVSSSRTREYLLLEDYIPAGFEIVDKGQIDYWDWNYWWVQRDVRDDRVSFYIDRLRGRRVVEYQMRAAVPGSYHALPAQIYMMYSPKANAACAEQEFTIR